MVRQEIFEGRVNLLVDGVAIDGQVVFHEPGQTFILAVEDPEAAERLIQQLAKAGAFREPVRLGELLARAGVRHLGHETCLIPHQRQAKYANFITALQASVTVTADRAWTYN